MISRNPANFRSVPMSKSCSEAISLLNVVLYILVHLALLFSMPSMRKHQV